jgi:hypothetical protein
MAFSSVLLKEIARTVRVARHDVLLCPVDLLGEEEQQRSSWNGWLRSELPPPTRAHVGGVKTESASRFQRMRTRDFTIEIISK